MELALFLAYENILEEYIGDKNPDIKNLANQLKIKVSSLQKKENY